MYLSLTQSKDGAAAPKKKRVSKKKKSAWRKYSNIKDVETFLEGERFEERLGVKFGTVEDKVLFYEDTKQESSRGNDIKPKLLTSKAERKFEAENKLAKGPKCYNILEERSSVPVPIITRNKVRNAKGRKNRLRKRIGEIPAGRGVLIAKEKEQNKSKVNAVQPKLKDLWADGNENNKLELDWLNETTLRHTMNNTRNVMKKVPSTITRKTSVLPAIEPPHPGTSYNPSYKGHSELLESIAEKEEVLLKDERHLVRVTDQMFQKVTPQQMEMDYLKEMSQGLKEPQQSKHEEENVGSEYTTVNPPTLNKKKTKKTRRNLKLAKLEEQTRKMKAIEKKKVADIYKLKKITEHLNKVEVKALEKQEIMKKKKEQKALEPKRLSKIKFQEHEPEFLMPHELRGTLREMKPQGIILYDRFKSMQKRNILPPTEFQRVRNRGKKKVFIKASHKIDFDKISSLEIHK